MMHPFFTPILRQRLAAILFVGLGCIALAPAAGAKAPAKTGYLPDDAVPSSLAQLPPPPAPGSPSMALDEAIAQRSFALRDTPRWTLAISDADLTFPHAAETYACTLGVSITETATPHLYHLLQRSQRDLGAAPRSAKNHYLRKRPYVINGQPMCTPDYSKMMAKEGSYPSGHTTVGWGWALILAEVAPESTDALMVRARAFGESRNVCNVHWHSDVMQARLLAPSVVSRLHTEAEFRADLEAARTELAAARAKGLKPNRDCAAEAAALAIEPSLAE
jgi:acid phosphatase (class A)